MFVASICLPTQGIRYLPAEVNAYEAALIAYEELKGELHSCGLPVPSIHMEAGLDALLLVDLGGRWYGKVEPVTV